MYREIPGEHLSFSKDPLYRDWCIQKVSTQSGISQMCVKCSPQKFAGDCPLKRANSVGVRSWSRKWCGKDSGNGILTQHWFLGKNGAWRCLDSQDSSDCEHPDLQYVHTLLHWLTHLMQDFLSRDMDRCFSTENPLNWTSQVSRDELGRWV